MKNWLKRNYYRWQGRSKGVTIGRNATFDTHNKFEGRNFIGDNAVLVATTVGLGSYISGGSVIKHTHIGRYCSIGSNIQTGLGTHPSDTFVSTHPAFFSTQKQAGFTFAALDIFEEHVYAGPDQKYIVNIGNDVWIGNNVIIMDGITIGDGAIVAAGAVVTKNVAPYAIVGGVPAKFIKERFNSQQVQKLQQLQWWNWDFGKVKAHSHLFNNIDAFLAAVN